MGELAVADQDAQAPGSQIGLVDLGYVVDDHRDGEGVVWPSPAFAGERDSARDCPVYVGELVRFDIALRPTGPGEGAKAFGQFLLHIDVESKARVVLPD